MDNDQPNVQYPAAAWKPAEIRDEAMPPEVLVENNAHAVTATFCTRSRQTRGMIYLNIIWFKRLTISLLLSKQLTNRRGFRAITTAKGD